VSEQDYMAFKYVTLHQEGHHSTEGQSSNGNMLDSGTFYVTDAKIYLMGRDRDWVYDFSKIRHVDFSNSSWKIDLEGKETPRYFKCESASNEVDPQLATAVINALRKHQL